MDEESIFAAALEKSADERSSFLDEACGPNRKLRAQVESLLRAHDDYGILEAQAPGLLATADQLPSGNGIAVGGKQIGPYKLLQQIGEGGFGLVYMAEQLRPVRRKVALKIVKPGMDSKDVVARFEAERQALAMMDHPNIAKVLDAGTTELGGPYFVMELVKGIPLTRFCEENNLPTQQRLELFATVCRAVHHAHQKGVIHRDIKPSNIMVTLHDGHPVPKVIDFGVSKALNQQLTEKTLFTRYGQMIGTPQYMSPEQAEMSGLDVDTRSDIYSLGVVLYELLTGTTPLDAERLRNSGFAEMQRLIREEEAPRPSTRLSTLGKSLATVARQQRTEPGRLQQLVHGELDWIAMKALEKERTRRYDSASGLADDIERFLRDETVEACPPSAAYRLRKLARRHKGPVIAATAVSLVLVLGIISTSVGLVAAKQSEGEAQAAKARADADREAAQKSQAESAALAEQLRREKYFADWHLAQAAWDRNDIAETRRLLRSHEEDPESQGFEYRYLWKLCQQQEAMKSFDAENAVWSVEFVPDSTTLVYGESDGDVTFLDYVSGESQTVHAHDRNVLSLAFSPDGKSMASASFDHTVKLWDVETRTLRYTVDTFGNWVHSAIFSPSGKLAVSTFDGRINVYEIGETKAKLIWELRDDVVSGMVHGTAFSHDGSILASSGDDPNIKLWNMETGELLHQLEGHENWVFCVAFSHDGETLASGDRDATLILWDTTGDVKDWKEKDRLEGHTNNIFSLDFAPDDRSLVSSSTDNTVRIWDVETGKESTSFRGHSADVFCARFNQYGDRVASGSLDKTVKLWDATAEREANELLGHTDYATAVAFSPNGDLLASTSFDRSVQIWDTASGRLLRTLPDHSDATRGIAFSPDGKTLAAAVFDGKIRFWDVESWEPIDDFPAHEVRTIDVAYSRDGKFLATAGKGKHPLKLWDAKTRELVKELDGHSGVGLWLEKVAFSPDSRFLVSCGSDARVIVWDLEAVEPAKVLEEHADTVIAVAFSETGQMATGDGEGNVLLWDSDLRQGKIVERLTSHTGWIWSLAFSPDAKTLAIASTDATVMLVDVETFQERITLRGHQGWVLSVAYSPDGNTIASASHDKSVRLWRAATEEEMQNAGR